TAMAQLGGDAAVAIVPPGLEGKPLDGGAQFHLFFIRVDFHPMPVEPRSANARSLAHPLHPNSALQGHHVPDVVVDASSPVAVFGWRRAFTLCKAPLKKSTSRARLARDCFSRWISSSSFFSRGTGSLIFFGLPSCMSLHRYNVRTWTPNS